MIHEPTITNMFRWTSVAGYADAGQRTHRRFCAKAFPLADQATANREIQPFPRTTSFMNISCDGHVISPELCNSWVEEMTEKGIKTIVRGWTAERSARNVYLT